MCETLYVQLKTFLVLKSNLSSCSSCFWVTYKHCVMFVEDIKYCQYIKEKMQLFYVD